MCDEFGVFDDLFHHVGSVESLGRFDLIKQKFDKSFLFVVITPNVCGDFPKNVDINIEILVVLLELLDDTDDLTWEQMIITYHN